MKRAIEAWRWSLGVVVRSPMSLLLLVILSALWGVGAYQWLWLPESSVFMLLLALVWALAQIFVATSVLAGTAFSAAAAVAEGGPPMGGLAFMTLDRRVLGRTILLSTFAIALIFGVVGLFGWINRHDVEVASFLTFHLGKPVSHNVIGKIFWTLEALLWTAIVGSLAIFLMHLLHAGWGGAWRRCPRTLASCCFRGSFWTGLASALVFGGLPHLLANWHPKVSPGFWDYLQIIFRLGLALILLVTGWFFWMLSLARMNVEPAGGSTP